MIPQPEIETSFKIDKDGAFRFAEKVISIPREERYYTKAKVKEIRKAFRKQFEF